MLRFLAILAMLAIATGAQAQVSATEIYEGIDKALVGKLQQPYGGDVDVDFLTRMLAQHDAAIERAKAVLANSSDAKIRMMAGDMLKTLHADQRIMKDWLTLHGPAQQVAQPAPLPKALLQAVQTDKVRVPAPALISSSKVASPSIPPTDLISSTIAATAMVSLSTVEPEAMPELPAPDAEIENTAPVMEFLDGGQ